MLIQSIATFKIFNRRHVSIEHVSDTLTPLRIGGCMPIFGNTAHGSVDMHAFHSIHKSHTD